MVEKEEEEMKYLNEHEREFENEGHLETPAVVSDVGKPRISKKMRAMLKSSGQKQINVKDLMRNVEPKKPEEVRAVL